MISPVSGITINETTLNWTAPGDDGDVGTASVYDIRYSTELITEENWDSAIQFEGEPVPQIAGSSESFEVELGSGTYYIAIKTADEVPNWSLLSNVISVTIFDYDINCDGVVDIADWIIITNYILKGKK